MQHAYDGQIKRFLTQFMRAMSLYSYKDAKGDLVQVPVRYGDITRQVASILNKNSENMLQSTPFIACYIKDIQYDRSRLQDPTFVSKLNIRERDFDATTGQYLSSQGAGYTIERLMPSPYTITFAADIWTSNFDQKMQLFEQIAVIFNPSLEIQSTDNYVDWGSLSVLEMDSSTFETRAIPQGVDSGISISSMTFKAPIWISPPAKVKKLGIITKIIANVFAVPTGSLDAISYGEIFSEKIADASIVITPDGHDILVLDGVAKLIKTPMSTVNSTIIDITQLESVSWRSILDLYPGRFRPNLSQLRLLKPDGTEIVAFMTLDSTDDAVMRLTYDVDTVPSNTILSDKNGGNPRGTIDAIIDPAKFTPHNLATDTRYMIVGDINATMSETTIIQPPGSPGPWRWVAANKPFFVAHENDIIQWDGSGWNVIFDSTTPNAQLFMTNTFTNIQYKFANGEWSKSYEGVYDVRNWRMIL